VIILLYGPPEYKQNILITNIMKKNTVNDKILEYNAEEIKRRKYAMKYAKMKICHCVIYLCTIVDRNTQLVFAQMLMKFCYPIRNTFT